MEVRRGHHIPDAGNAEGDGIMTQLARQNQFAEVRAQITKQLGQFAAVLPAHIPPERFGRVVLTGIQNNPELLDVDRRSLLNACMKAAQDGLLPDGRLGALVVYKDKKRQTKTAQWLPMIAGIRQKVRNSGEIADWHARVVYERDVWEYEEGDNPHILHKPTPGDRGKPIAAYSVAWFRSGEISREWMWIEDLDKVRSVSRAERGPWQDWTEEMYKKTVAKRHAKTLPMSSDLDDLLRRPDEPGGGGPAGGVTPLVAAKSGESSPSAALTAAFDQLSAPPSHYQDPQTLGREFHTTADDAVDADPGGEVIDAGEYAESDHEELPPDEQNKRVAGTA
jgi:recombination protein RecT